MANAASITTAVKRHLRGHGLDDVPVNTRSCHSGTGAERRWGWQSIVHADQAGLTVDQVVDALADFPRELQVSPSETGFVSVWQIDQ
jgi:hypothetical protein